MQSDRIGVDLRGSAGVDQKGTVNPRWRRARNREVRTLDGPQFVESMGIAAVEGMRGGIQRGREFHRAARKGKNRANGGGEGEVNEFGGTGWGMTEEELRWAEYDR